jgi:hypothetical protein
VLHKGEVGEVYNIGTEKERSVLDVSGGGVQGRGLGYRVDWGQSVAMPGLACTMWGMDNARSVLDVSGRGCCCCCCLCAPAAISACTS